MIRCTTSTLGGTGRSGGKNGKSVGTSSGWDWKRGVRLAGARTSTSDRSGAADWAAAAPAPVREPPARRRDATAASCSGVAWKPEPAVVEEVARAAVCAGLEVELKNGSEHSGGSDCEATYLRGGGGGGAAGTPDEVVVWVLEDAVYVGSKFLIAIWRGVLQMHEL